MRRERAHEDNPESTLFVRSMDTMFHRPDNVADRLFINDDCLPSTSQSAIKTAGMFSSAQSTRCTRCFAEMTEFHSNAGVDSYARRSWNVTQYQPPYCLPLRNDCFMNPRNIGKKLGVAAYESHGAMLE